MSWTLQQSVDFDVAQEVLTQALAINIQRSDQAEADGDIGAQLQLHKQRRQILDLKRDLLPWNHEAVRQVIDQYAVVRNKHR